MVCLLLAIAFGRWVSGVFLSLLEDNWSQVCAVTSSCVWLLGTGTQVLTQGWLYSLSHSSQLKYWKVERSIRPEAESRGRLRHFHLLAPLTAQSPPIINILHWGSFVMTDGCHWHISSFKAIVCMRVPSWCSCCGVTDIYGQVSNVTVSYILFDVPDFPLISFYGFYLPIDTSCLYKHTENIYISGAFGFLKFKNLLCFGILLHLVYFSIVDKSYFQFLLVHVILNCILIIGNAIWILLYFFEECWFWKKKPKNQKAEYYLFVLKLSLEAATTLRSVHLFYL